MDDAGDHPGLKGRGNAEKNPAKLNRFSYKQGNGINCQLMAIGSSCYLYST
jgi:hypothetical protein